MAINWKIRKKHKPVPGKEYKKLLLWLYDYKCCYCGKRLHNNFHPDHKVAYYFGGKTTINNMCASCPGCNIRKGTDDWSEVYNPPNPIKLVIAYWKYLKLFKLEHLL